MTSNNEIRLGLGRVGGMRSSSWKVSGGGDSSVYVQSRDIGGYFKASLHPPDPARPGTEWRLAWTREADERDRVPEGHEDRVLDAWDSEVSRLDDTPLKHAFIVTLGRYSLASAACRGRGGPPEVSPTGRGRLG